VEVGLAFESWVPRFEFSDFSLGVRGGFSVTHISVQ
jgi:hypothetical protein